jgi:hypothetical protein
VEITPRVVLKRGANTSPKTLFRVLQQLRLQEITVVSSGGSVRRGVRATGRTPSSINAFLDIMTFAILYSELRRLRRKPQRRRLWALTVQVF